MDTINIYYHNQMHHNYKKRNNNKKNIKHRYIKPVDKNKYIRFIIYYKKFKTNSLAIKNNISQTSNLLYKTNVVYEYTCLLRESFIVN